MRALSRKFILIFTIISMLSLWILPAYAVPAVSLSLSETTFSPNGDGFRDTTIVWFNFSGSVRVTVRVLSGSSVVATLHNNISLTGGPRAFIWGGTTGLTGGPGLPDGRYTMQVLVTDGSGTGSDAGDFIIARNLIGPGSIENGAVTRDKIAFDAIDGSRVAPKSLGAREISLAIGNAELGDDAVTSGKIKDGEVKTADLADGAVTGAKAPVLVAADAAEAAARIAGDALAWTAANDGSASGLDADTVDGVHAAGFAVAGHNHDAAYVNDNAGEVDSTDIMDGSILGSDIGNNVISELNMADNSIFSQMVGNGSLTGADIAAGSLTQAQISSVGLDADTVDGVHGTALVAADAVNAAAIATEIDAREAGDTAESTTRAADDATEAAARIAGDALAWTATNDGSGSGLDADTLDGLDSSSFVDNSAAIAAEAATRAAGDAVNAFDIFTEGSTRAAADVAEITTRFAADAADAAAWALADTGIYSALTSEATTRALEDGNRLYTGALGTGVRMESGTVTVNTFPATSDATTSIVFATSFITTPIVLVSLENMTDATAKIVNIRGKAVSLTGGLATIFTEADGVGTGVATIRWVAIGN